MRPATSRLWEVQNRHPGDRESLFAAVAAFTEVGAVLYPGSWADVTASFVFDSVIYVDSDSKAAYMLANMVSPPVEGCSTRWRIEPIGGLAV